MTQRILMFIFACMSGVLLSAQGVYRFLDLPVSAHEAGFGGQNVSLYSDGISAAIRNPALLTDETHNQLALNFTNYIANVPTGNVAYGRNWGKHRFGAAFQFIDFGTFQGRDEFNQDTGEFSAKDFALNLIYSRPLSAHWSIGANLKSVYSAYERYTSFGMGVDVGASYLVPESGLCLGFTLANIGHQFSSYAGETEWLPFNTLFSISKKFAHAPIRISVTLHHLHKWNLGYTNNITSTGLDGEKIYEKVHFVDMFFRHVIAGIDIVPTKNIYITASYNRQRAAELNIKGVRSINGFSFGAGVKVYKFQIGFALAPYQRGIMSYHFSLSTDLNDFGIK